MMKKAVGAALVMAGVLPMVRCSSSVTPLVYPSRAAMLDPATCKNCHADHYRDWSGSMHAYASDDPVFLAMNARGQRETNGVLAGFCANCHAPMAVREGATTDGTNLATVPQELKGVTCFFCHAVDDVNGSHDNPLHLASDITMRGPFSNAMATAGHPSAYSTLHDRDRADSAKLCGACHDIVNGHGVNLERTYQEWQASVFAKTTGATCGQCHMDQSAALVPIAQVSNAPLRRYHDHAQPGVDLALTNFAETDAQKQKVQTLLDTTLQSALCVGDANSGIGVILDNVAAGHSWPSGAAQDRRAWVEVIAYAGDQILYSSGVVRSGEDVTKLADPDLWLLRDCMFDDTNGQVPMFWQATTNESYLLPGQATFDVTDPRYYATHLLQAYPRAGALSQAPDRVTMRVRIEPVGLDVIDDLVQTGDLDVALRQKIPTFDLGSAPLIEWTKATAKLGYNEGPIQFTCVSNTSLNFTAQTVPAPAHARCKP